jgi:hypothetical protein
MSLVLSGQAINAEKQDLSKDAKSNLTKHKCSDFSSLEFFQHHFS